MDCILPDGKKIYYTIQGDQSGEILLCINGLSQSTIIWSGMNTLMESDYQIINLDLIFQGQSDKTGNPRSISQHADDVIFLMDYLELSETNIIGFFFGSIVAQNLMVRHPDRVKKAVLLASYGRATARYLDIINVLLKILKSDGLREMLDVLYPLTLSPAFFEAPPMPIHEIKDMTMQYNSSEAIYSLMVELIKEKDHLAELEKTDIPSLVVQGEYDFLCLPETAKELANRIHNSQFKLISGVGHTLNIEAIPQIAGLIKNFIPPLPNR